MPQQGEIQYVRSRLSVFMVSLSSILLMGVWFGIFFLDTGLFPVRLLPISWHAYSMTFGFGGLLIASYFLSIEGGVAKRYFWLGALMLLWGISKGFPFVDHSQALLAMLVFDLLFLAVLLLLVFSRRQSFSVIVLISLFVLIVIYGSSLLAYFWGLMQEMYEVEQMGLSVGLYALLSILILLGECSICLDQSSKVKVSRIPLFLVFASLLSLAVFAVMDVYGFAGSIMFVVILISAGLFLIMAGYRLFFGQVTDLLNSAVAVAYLFIVLGLAFKAAGLWHDLLLRLANHAFAIGAVGLLAMAIMALPYQHRKGRNTAVFLWHEFLIFGAISGSAFIFLLLPLWLAPKYVLLVAVSQLGWITGFGLILFLQPQKSRHKRERKHPHSQAMA